MSALAHLEHHLRFYASALLGLCVFLAAPSFALPLRLIGAGDAFFLAYLICVGFLSGQSADDLRERSAYQDEGIFVVVLVVLSAIATSCGSIVVILHQSHGRMTSLLGAALASAPLGWFALHAVAACHYAHLYYAPRNAGQGADLVFPGAREPGMWEFLYYSFVVGMTAQVSDVQIAGTQMRRATLGHGVVSFFFNTVLIAMAVNAVVTIAS